MSKKDVIAFMGRAPDRIGGPRMVSAEWKCSGCREHFSFPTPVPVPAPCGNCGGIFFEKLQAIH